MKVILYGLTQQIVYLILPLKLISQWTIIIVDGFYIQISWIAKIQTDFLTIVHLAIILKGVQLFLVIHFYLIR